MTDLLIKLFVKNSEETSNPAVHARYGRMAGLVGICCNLLLAAAKLFAGLLSQSIAIMADAVNNLSDASSSLITLIGFKLAERPADEGHPYGHARFEYIAGLAVSVMVLVIGLELGKSSVEKIISPQPVQYGIISLLVLALSALVKMWMAGFNRKIGRRIGSTALQATFADSRNDAVATAALLAAALVARVTDLNLDGWMGLFVAVFILISGVGLVRETLNPLLGAAPEPEFVQDVRRKILSYDGVLGTHDLIVHDYGPGNQFASAHVEMDAGMDVMRAHDIIDGIERDFLQRDKLHLIIHYDPICTGGRDEDDIRCRVLAAVQSVDAALTIHDLRLEEQADHEHYIFDVVAPPDCTYDDGELQCCIECALQHGPKPIEAKIRIDHSYAPIPAKTREGQKEGENDL